MRYAINIFISLLLSLMVISCDEITEVLEESALSNEEVIQGLKAALEVSTDSSVNTLSAIDGYLADAAVKILLPPEAEVIEENIAKVPGGRLLIENAIKAINRAAEDAAIEARPIFLDAIMEMSIEDGFAILNGPNDAATSYLRVNTETNLIDAFTPKVRTSLNKKLIGNVSAESTYKALVDAYNVASLNGVLFPKVEQNSLSKHTTKKALDGLFIKVADEEHRIRTDVNHRVSELLKKVFGDG